MKIIVGMPSGKFVTGGTWSETAMYEIISKTNRYGRFRKLMKTRHFN